MSEYVGLKQGKVHDRHEMSEYYCGGCGWPVTDHDSYCSECGGELHEGIDKSRWNQLFGTPERVARTLHSCCAKCWCNDCTTCRLAEFMGYKGDEHALLEWLRGDAE